MRGVTLLRHLQEFPLEHVDIGPRGSRDSPRNPPPATPARRGVVPPLISAREKAPRDRKRNNRRRSPARVRTVSGTLRRVVGSGLRVTAEKPLYGQHGFGIMAARQTCGCGCGAESMPSAALPNAPTDPSGRGGSAARKTTAESRRRAISTSDT